MTTRTARPKSEKNEWLAGPPPSERIFGTDAFNGHRSPVVGHQELSSRTPIVPTIITSPVIISFQNVDEPFF
jgi:hypothetical protein